MLKPVGSWPKKIILRGGKVQRKSNSHQRNRYCQGVYVFSHRLFYEVDTL